MPVYHSDTWASGSVKSASSPYPSRPPQTLANGLVAYNPEKKSVGSGALLIRCQFPPLVQTSFASLISSVVVFAAAERAAATILSLN